jgi:hypothetical protein
MNGPLTSALARHHRRTTSNGGSSDGAGSPHLMPGQAPVTPGGAAPAGMSVQSAPSAAGTLSPQSTGGASVVAAAGTAAGTAAAGQAPGAGAGFGAGAGAGASVSGATGLTPSRSQYHDSTDDEVLQAYQQIRAERQRAEQQQHMQQSSARGRQQQQQVNGMAAAAAGGGQQRDVTQLMADKMVAGWALLGDHCPM